MANDEKKNLLKQKQLYQRHKREKNFGSEKLSLALKSSKPTPPPQKKKIHINKQTKQEIFRP